MVGKEAGGIERLAKAYLFGKGKRVGVARAKDSPCA
jgi:hypothetical protein